MNVELERYCLGKTAKGKVKRFSYPWCQANIFLGLDSLLRRRKTKECVEERTLSTNFGST